MEPPHKKLSIDIDPLSYLEDDSSGLSQHSQENGQTQNVPTTYAHEVVIPNEPRDFSGQITSMTCTFPILDLPTPPFVVPPPKDNF